MPALHTVNKSPFRTDGLLSCLKHCKPGDRILLIEDGIYSAIAGSSVAGAVAAVSDDVQVFALEEDLQARGIDRARLLSAVSCVDYGGFVDLVVQTNRTQSWL